MLRDLLLALPGPIAVGTLFWFQRSWNDQFRAAGWDPKLWAILTAAAIFWTTFLTRYFDLW